MPFRWALLLLVGAATVAAYAPAIDGAFVLDDESAISEAIASTGSVGAGTAWLRSGRPTTAATFALNAATSGVHRRAWHLTNLVVHLAAVVLAFLFARATLERAGLSSPDGPALVAAALFALHPMQTESVEYVTQRAESLASGLYLAAFVVFLARDRAGSRSRRAALVVAGTALHALALGAKPVAATFPAAWLLFAAILPARGEKTDPALRRVWRRIPAALPAFALSLAAVGLTVAGTAGSTHAGYSVPGVSAGEYAATQLRVVPTYLRLLLWPSGQCVDWEFRVSRSFLEPHVLAGAVLLIGLAAAAVLAAWRFRAGEGDGAAAARVASFGTLFFLLALTPSSSLVPLLDPLAEHRVYLACLGVFLGAAAAAAAVLRRVARQPAVAGAAIAVALLTAAAVATARRNEVWRTPLGLWSDAVRNAPGKSRVHAQLGHALQAAGRPQEALASFLRARASSGDLTVSEDAIRVHVVSALLAVGRRGEARIEVERALTRSPKDATLLATKGQLEFFAGDDAGCERALRAALAVEPQNPKALKYLGMLRVEQGELAAAREAFRAAAAFGSLDPLVFRALGDAEAAGGDVPAACRAYRIAAELPGNGAASERAAQAGRTLGCR
ncbi:MAG TPA: hypothetical protein VF894_05775 [Anaeromyxobacter sp.]